MKNYFNLSIFVYALQKKGCYVLENGDQGAPLEVSNRSGIVVGPKGFSEVLGGLTGILRVSGMILKSLKYP